MAIWETLFKLLFCGFVKSLRAVRSNFAVLSTRSPQSQSPPFKSQQQHLMPYHLFRSFWPQKMTPSCTVPPPQQTEACPSSPRSFARLTAERWPERAQTPFGHRHSSRKRVLQYHTARFASFCHKMSTPSSDKTPSTSPSSFSPHRRALTRTSAKTLRSPPLKSQESPTISYCPLRIFLPQNDLLCTMPPPQRTKPHPPSPRSLAQLTAER